MVWEFLFLIISLLLVLYRMKKILIGFVAVSFAIAGIVYIASWNLKRTTTATYSRNAVNAPYDVIIIPGIPYDTARQNILLKVRIFWAKSLFDKGIAKNIIFSGAAVHTPWVEGKVMKIIADSLGIPASHTFTEDKAKHGNENIYYSCKLAQQLGFKKIALATDQYQNSFLVSFIKNIKDGIAELPVTVDSFPVYEKRHLPVIDAREAFVNNFIPLNKKESRWQRVRDALSNDTNQRNQ